MKLQHPPAETEWMIVQSFIIEHPPSLFSDSLPELRLRIAALARNANKSRSIKKRIKGLSFRYETDELDMVTTVYVMFSGYVGRNIRFMKLTRIPDAA